MKPSPVLPSLPLSSPVSWDALRAPFAYGYSWTYDSESPFALAYHIACSLPSCAGPNGERVKGWPLPIERDTIAITRGIAWRAKIEVGQTSCAWHEIAEHYDTLDKCACSKCQDARKVCRAV